MNTAIVVYDANVLYPATLRDLLVELAFQESVAARWTAAIHDEWTRNLSADRPGLAAAVGRTRRRMDAAVPHAVVTGYEERIPTLTLPDPDDRHVLAAAIYSGAAHIVTFNLRDFPAASLARYGVTAVHPDDFVTGLLAAAPADVLGAVRAIRERMTRPQLTAAEYLAGLARQGLPRTTAALAQFADQL